MFTWLSSSMSPRYVELKAAGAWEKDVLETDNMIKKNRPLRSKTLRMVWFRKMNCYKLLITN